MCPHGVATLHAAAQREFEEETGAALAPPLTAEDLGRAALASVRGGSPPRWLAFLRVTRDEREFDDAVAACARPASSQHAHGYPIEVYGSAGVPVYIEGARGGFPRQLASMAPRMQRMVLALLGHGGVLTAAEARELSEAGDAVWASTRQSRDPGDAEWAAKSPAAVLAAASAVIAAAAPPGPRGSPA